MSAIIKKLMDAAHRYTVMDFAALKIYLLSLGILLGSYFSYFFGKYLSIVWVIVLISLGIVVMRTIRHYRK